MRITKGITRRGNSWQVRAMHKGVLIYKQFDYKVDAEKYLAEERRRIDLGNYYEVHKTLRETYTEMDEELRHKGKKKEQTSIHTDSVFYNHIAKLLNVDRYLNTFTIEEMREFQKRILQCKLSAGTKGGIIALLKQIFSYALKYGWIQENVSRILEKPKGEETEVKIFTDSQIELLFNDAEKRFKTNPNLLCMLALGIYGGLRKGEMLGLQWQDIDFGGSYDETTFDDEMHKAMEHLSLVFHRYLYGEDGIRKLRIRVNGRVLTPKDPFLQHVEGEKHGHQCKATQALGSGKNRITLQAFVLPHEKELTDEMRRLLGTDKLLRRTQGFYIYRNKRLITYGNWHGLRAQGEFFKLARVKVDIPNSLDLEWSLDVKKSVAIPPKKIVEHLKAYVDSVVRQSVNAIRVQVFGRKRKSDRPDMHPWDTRITDGIVTSVQVNRNHPAVRAALGSGAIAEKLLVMLERTLPIDTIYYSRSNERKLDNEMPFSEEELVDMLKGLIATIPKGQARRNAFQTFLLSDPFAMCADVLAKREEEVLNAIV